MSVLLRNGCLLCYSINILKVIIKERALFEGVPAEPNLITRVKIILLPFLHKKVSEAQAIALLT